MYQMHHPRLVKRRYWSRNSRRICDHFLRSDLTCPVFSSFGCERNHHKKNLSIPGQACIFPECSGRADPREPTRHIWISERTKIDKLCQLGSPANFLYGTSFGGSITSNLLVRSLRVIAMKSVAGTQYNEKKLLCN